MPNPEAPDLDDLQNRFQEAIRRGNYRVQPGGMWSANKRHRHTGLEHINHEIKRRSRVVRIFPNPESCRRPVCARLKERHEDWITGRRYIDMTPLWEAEESAEEEVTPAA